MSKVKIMVVSFLLLSAMASAQQTISTEKVAGSSNAISGGSEAGKITFSFKDADMHNVLRLISAKSGVNIVYGPEITGLVTMELKDVPWEQALGLVLDVNGFAYQREGSVIKVLKKESVSKEPMVTDVFVLNYANAVEAAKVVEQMLTDPTKIKVDVRSNTIIVTDIPSSVNKIETVLKRLDTRTSQVLIETKILEIKYANQKDLGIKWTSLESYNIGIKDPITGYGPSRTYKSIRRGGKGIWDDTTDNVDTDGKRDVYVTSTGDNTEDVRTTSSSDSNDFTGTTTTTYDPVTGRYISSSRTDQDVDGTSSSIDDVLTQTTSNNITSTLTKTLSSTLLKSDIRSAVLSADAFQVALSALQTDTDTNLISNPRVLTADNEEAQIKIVSEYPVPNYEFDTETSQWSITGFTKEPIGVVFNVTPSISSDGYITMKIEPEVSKLLDVVPFTAGGATVNVPYIGRKKASSKLVIQSGDTLAVGGLVDEDNVTTVTKIPLLGDVPVLGRLFRHDSVTKVKTDVVFFITATIIDESTRAMLESKGVTNVVEAEPAECEKIINIPKAIPVAQTESEKGNKGVISQKTPQ